MHEFQDSHLSPEDRLTRNEALPAGDAGRLIEYQPRRYRGGGYEHVVTFQTTLARTHAHASLGSVDRRSDPARSVVKRGFDVLAATLGLLVLLPGLAAVALAIKLTSRGPLVFRQQRYGLNNTEFVVYKFRTMYFDETDVTGVKQTREDDDRITPIGRVLRRFSLDELPQLVNVVKGDMSLVGPRPHVPGMLAAGVPYEILVPGYFERHRVRPGLTGLAQARGFRGSTVDAEFAKARIASDLEYIQNWSFMLDMRIIIETVWREFLRGGDGI